MSRSFVFCAINSDENRALSRSLHVTALPLTIFFTKDGEKIQDLLGSCSAAGFVQNMEKAWVSGG